MTGSEKEYRAPDGTMLLTWHLTANGKIRVVGRYLAAFCDMAEESVQLIP